MTRTLAIGCDLGYSTNMSTPSIFQVTPRADTGIAQQEKIELVDETWSTTGDLEVTEYTDLFGNPCRRLTLPPGQTVVSYHATAIVPDEVDEADPGAPEVAPEDLPAEVLMYTLPSRFCQSDELSHAAWKLFGRKEPGYGRVSEICSWAWSYLTYAAGSTNSRSTAVDGFVSAKGVCRDYAHLMVSMCRGLNIPARYAAGYLPDMDVAPLPTPMDFHAWVEVWLGDRWWVFDPRHNARRKGRVKIAHGRDAADLPSATMFGSTILTRFDIVAHERGV